MESNKNIQLGGLVRFGCTTHNPASGFNQYADSTPRWLVFEENDDTIMLQDNFVIRGGIPGAYKGFFNAVTASGFESRKNYEIFASGTIGGISSIEKICHFIIDDIYNSNIVQISGTYINYDDVVSNIYFADIKYIKDNVVLQDDYGVQWFKNGLPTTSGQLTNPAMTVFNGITGAALLSNKVMSYPSMNLGVVQYTETTTGNLTASGIPYLVVASGTIDSAVRTWRHVVGLDT